MMFYSILSCHFFKYNQHLYIYICYLHEFNVLRPAFGVHIIQLHNEDDGPTGSPLILAPTEDGVFISRTNKMVLLCIQYNNDSFI